ncbi:MAG TPA: PilZ domain-containing protein [Sphingomicrobium sp.]|nr:PilZ domain-containing protein [Sphingomicrobium sp.]
MHGWIGRKDRQPVAVDAVIHRTDGTSSAIKLSNISDEGCRIESDDLRIGEQVEIAIPEYGQLKAQVRWALAGSAGAKFLADGDA